MAKSIEYYGIGWIQFKQIFIQFENMGIDQGYGKTIPCLLVPHPLLQVDSQSASEVWSSEIFPSRL